jgi:hypothetical protein
MNLYNSPFDLEWNKSFSCPLYSKTKLLKKDLGKLNKAALQQKSQELGLSTLHNGTYVDKTKDQMILNIVNYLTKMTTVEFSNDGPELTIFVTPAEIPEIPEDYKPRVAKLNAGIEEAADAEE